MTMWIVATDVIARELREVERLGDDALAREGGVAVNEHREVRDARPWADSTSVPSLGRITRSCLARTMPSTTGDTASRCEGFEAIETSIVAPLGFLNTPRAPLWYLTSPLPCTLSGSRLPSNSREDVAVGLADDVGEHVQTSAVRHADDGFLDALVGRVVEDRLEGHDGRLRALETEALLADVASVQEALEDLGLAERTRGCGAVRRALSEELTPSTRSWIHFFCSGSMMWPYSMPVVRQYASRRIERISSSVASLRPGEPVHDEGALQVPDREAVGREFELGVQGWRFAARAGRGGRSGVRARGTY